MAVFAYSIGISIHHIFMIIEIALALAANLLLALRIEVNKSAAGISYKMALLEVMPYLLMLPQRIFIRSMYLQCEFWVKLLSTTLIVYQMRVRYPSTVQHEFDHFSLKSLWMNLIIAICACAYFSFYMNESVYAAFTHTLYFNHLYTACLPIPCQTYMFVQMAKAEEICIDSFVSRFVVLITLRRVFAIIRMFIIPRRFGKMFIFYSFLQVLITGDFVVKYIQAYKRGTETIFLKI